MDEHVQAIVDEVLARLRELVGEAWVEPARVDGLLRFKLRTNEAEPRWFVTVKFIFDKIEVQLEINCGERLITKVR